MKRFCIYFLLFTSVLVAQDNTGSASGVPGFSLTFGSGDDAQDFSTALQLMLLMTFLTLAPSMIILMTSFTRIVIVLGFVRTAMGVNQAPSNQIIIGLAIFLTFFIMTPTLDRLNENVLEPLSNKEITSKEAMTLASAEMKAFMLTQTREKNIEFMLSLANMGQTTVKDLPMRVIIPAFILSELQTAFQMGFMLFVPFIVIDFIIASALMAMGMMMMPPTMIALPFKILLFVLIDGWSLVIGSLVKSFT